MQSLIIWIVGLDFAGTVALVVAAILIEEWRQE